MPRKAYYIYNPYSGRKIAYVIEERGATTIVIAPGIASLLHPCMKNCYDIEVNLSAEISVRDLGIIDTLQGPFAVTDRSAEYAVKAVENCIGYVFKRRVENKQVAKPLREVILPETVPETTEEGGGRRGNINQKVENI